MNSTIYNRFEVAGDGWIQLSPYGEFAHGGKLLQVVDSATVGELVKNFSSSVLVDFDHLSDDPARPTTAAGWIDGIEGRDSGLWGHVRWSEAGERAVRNGEYRFVSPVWEVEEEKESLQLAVGSGQAGKFRRVRPVRLVEAGLTNKPNIRGSAPLSNRETILPGSPASATVGDLADNQRRKKNMKLIAQKLGLSADTSEEGILGALDKLTNRAAAAEAAVVEVQNRVSSLETENAALLEGQIVADLVARGITDEKVKNRLLPVLKGMGSSEDRAAFMEECFGTAEKPAGQNKLFNRQAKAPAVAGVATGADVSTLRNRAVAEFRATNHCDFETAWNAVRVAKPELFKEETK